MGLVKKLLIGIGALLVVIAFCLFFFLGSIVKAGIEKGGPLMTGTKVSVGTVTLSPFSGQGRIRNFAVGNPAGYKSESSIRMKDFRINIVPRSLTGNVVLIRSVYIEGPEITKEGGNLEAIMRNVQSRIPQESSDKKSSKKIIIDDLLVKGARVNVEVLGKMTTITIPDIHLTGIGRESGGTTPAKAAEKVLGSVLSGVTAGIRNIGRSVTDEAGKIGSGLKDLIKKKR